jgi:hypothetical protein
MEMLTPFVVPGIALLLTLVVGFWLRSSGKPYNGFLFNIHKLIALAAVVLTALQLYPILQGSELQAPGILLIIAAGLSMVGLFATGAIMSIQKGAADLPRIIHNVALVLVIITMAATIYLLAGSQL